MIFNGFWKPLGTNFGVMLTIVSYFGAPNCRVDSRVVFSVWAWHQDAIPGCIENIANIVVFVRFAVLEEFEF